MNATVLADENVIRHIVQNVTEHLHEDEKDSFLLAYTLFALIVCLLLSYLNSLLHLFIVFGSHIEITGFHR